MSNMSKKHYLKRHWKAILNVLTFVGLGVLVYVTRKQLGQALENLKNINAWVLLLIIPIEILNYDAYARMYSSLFKVLGDKLEYREAYRVALETNFVNQIFPSAGVSGFSYFGFRLKRYGISGGKATLVQTMKFIFIFLSFEVLLSLGLLTLALGGQASNLTILIAGTLSTLLVVGTFGIAYIIGDEKRIEGFFTFITRGINRLIHYFRPRHPETINISNLKAGLLELHQNYLLLRKEYKALKWPLINGLVANATEVAAVYIVYIAFGHWVNPGAVILAYAVANFAGLISVLPGGVGIYEFLMAATLATAGVSPALSIPVTVMYRIFNITLQLSPGYYFYQKTLHEPTPSE